MGQFYPDPTQFVLTRDGVEVPCGELRTHADKKSLLYNEYIVYDTRQIKFRYLVKMRFKY